MKERPILFSSPMVRALLAGTKTQTRRVVKPWEPRSSANQQPVPEDVAYLPDFTCYRSTCPYGQPGDRLWVRETFSYSQPPEPAVSGALWYWADGNPSRGDWTRPKPSIHMPRWASRITLEITGVRVERLQAISEADAIAEGIERMDGAWWRNYIADSDTDAYTHLRDPRMSFASLWVSINGDDSWDANPWVWLIEFKKLED